MDPPSLETQLKFIDDATKIARNDMRIFVCNPATLSALTGMPVIGGHKARIVTQLNQYPENYHDFAKEGSTGFDIIYTNAMPPPEAGRLLDRAKDWFYPERYEHTLCMAIVINHWKFGFYQNELKINACCIDMDNAYLLGMQRRHYKF